MRRGQDYSPISPSKLSSTSFRNFNHYHKYENMSLMNKLPGDSYEDLFRSKLVLNDPFISLEAKNAQDKYAELEKHVRELYEEFKLHCIPGEVRDMIPEPKDADSDPVEVAKAIRGILQLLQKTLKEQEQVNLLNVENRKDIDYELLLQKAEGDIKKHIRTHQQLKFVIETMQAKIEEYDSDKGIFLQNAKSVFKDAKSDNKTLIDMIRQKDTEIHILNAKMKQKDETIKSHEERLLSIPILEHKIKGLKDSHAKEKELVKQYYQQEFANLTKEVQHIHKVLSTNLNLDERLKMLEQELNTYKNFNVKKLQSLEDKLSQFDSHNEKIENVLSQAVSLHEGLDPTDIKSTILAAVLPTRAPVKIHHRPRNLLQNKSVSSLHKALEEKHTLHKQRLVKKKSEVSDEIKMLSVSRIQDLTQEIADPHQDFHRSTSPKKFDSYFIALKRKLDKLNQINNKEREFLKSINSQTAEIPARETRTRQGVSRVVVKKLNDESMHDHKPAFLSPKSVPSKTNTNRASSVQPKV